MHGKEMDVEALQAQIDLSNSVAFDLVSSWMKPGSFAKGSVSASIARELEEHAKRPPRLGLGASVSKASAATAREAAKSRGKLVGTKRARDEGRASAAVQAQEEEDDGESRSTAISAKVKVNGTGGLALGLANPKDKGKGRAVEASNDAENPFVTPAKEDGSPKKKRKKKKHHAGECSHDGPDSNVLGTPSKNHSPTIPQTPPMVPSVINLVSPFPIATAPKSNPFTMPQTPQPEMPSVINLVSPLPLHNVVSAEGPGSSKKKKKKEHKAPSSKPPEGEEEWHGFSTDALDPSDFTHSSHDISSGSKQAMSHPSAPNRPSKTVNPSSSTVLDPTTPVQPAPSPSRIQVNKSNNILNLNVSSSLNARTTETEERAASKSLNRKKPRRRRGKRKNSRGAGDGES